MPNDITDDRTSITTTEYRITPGIYAREAVSHWTGRFWFLMALPITALACYGVWFDWRYIVVTACIVFILFPSFALAGFNMALTSRGARYALYPQKVTLAPDDSLTVEFSPIPPRVTQRKKQALHDSDSDTEARDNADSSPEEIETMPAAPAPEPLVIGRDHIESCSRWKGHTVVNCANGLRLIIPDRSFTAPGDSIRFEERLGSGT